jgi:hypothetical protein
LPWNFGVAAGEVVAKHSQTRFGSSAPLIYLRLGGMVDPCCQLGAVSIARG